VKNVFKICVKNVGEKESLSSVLNDIDSMLAQLKSEEYNFLSMAFDARREDPIRRTQMRLLAQHTSNIAAELKRLREINTPQEN
jgi:hypothetical protein